MQTTYPPAPWHLRGWGIATVQLVDWRAASDLVPSGCRVVAVVPGKTLGGVVFLSYEAGSTLVYRELNVVAGLVRVGLRFAFYLPRLYVDSAASLSGGRAIWGVPKEDASFEVTVRESERRVVVRRGDQEVCRLETSAPRADVTMSLGLPAVGAKTGSLVFFTGRMRARLGLVRSRITLPDEGVLRALALDRPAFAFLVRDFTLRVPVPAEPSLAPGASQAAAPGVAMTGL